MCRELSDEVVRPIRDAMMVRADFAETMRLSYSWFSIPNSFRACLLRKLFSHRDFPVQLAVRAVGPLQGGESSSVSDFRTGYALLGPKS